MPKLEIHCPVCKRFCGPSQICPYCDTLIPIPALYRTMRRTAWLLATVGLLILILATRYQPPETIPIADISPTMQFARLTFEGTLTRAPRISRNQRSASTDMDDGSGATLRLVFLDEAVEYLRNQQQLPAGSRLRVHGNIRIQADEPPVLFIRQAEQFSAIEVSP